MMNSVRPWCSFSFAWTCQEQGSLFGNARRCEGVLEASAA